MALLCKDTRISILVSLVIVKTNCARLCGISSFDTFVNFVNSIFEHMYNKMTCVKI